MKRSLPKELAFAESEYRLRVDKVRELMGEKGLDVLLVTFSPNVCYLSGYQGLGTGSNSCLIVPGEGEPILQVHELEVGPAVLSSWVKDIRRGVIWTDPAAMTGELVGLLKEGRFEGKRIGVETKRLGLPIDIYEGVKSALPDATLIDASDVVPQLRMIKSPAELDHMRRAAQITKKGLAAALPVIKPGITENQIAAVILQTLVNEGSEYFSTQPCISGAYRAGISHTTFKRTPIQVGQTVILEFGAVYERYTSAIAHTVAIGKPSSAVEKMAKLSNETLDLLLHTVKPGRIAHDVAREVGAFRSRELKEISADVSYGGVFGYAIGLGAPPTWSEEIYHIREGIEQELMPGMTFHSPLGLRIPGTTGVSFSETWVVTEQGCEVLTKHDRELTVVAV